MFLQYVYLSKSLIHFDNFKLETLVQNSLAANEIYSVSGFLAYHNEFFWQYIEGARNDVENLSDNLKRDSRHRIISDFFSETNQRKFPGWSMSLVSTSKNNDLEIKPVEHVKHLMKTSIDNIKNNQLKVGIWESVQEISDIYKFRERIVENHICHTEFVDDGQNKGLKQPEEVLRAKLSSAIAAKLKAEEANEAKRVFLANISHEIRTPLSSIIGFIALIKEHVNSENPEIVKYFQSITSSANHLTDLLSDILDFSKIEADKVDINIKEFDLISEVEKIKSSFMDKSIAKNISINLCCNTKINKVQSDPKFLRQILINLLGNAFKFTQDGGKINIAIDEKIETKKIEISIEDTGIGIEDSFKSLIFAPFRQGLGENTNSRGTGLGLSISKKLAKKLGGDLVLLRSSTNKMNHGSKFKLSIPRDHLSSSNLHKVPLEDRTKRVSVDAEKAGLQQLKIIIAEDDLEILELLKRILSSSGAEVVTCLNGNEVLAHDLEEFDVVLLDIKMPVKDGIETVRSIRKQNFVKPVIALSADARMEQKNRCIEAGFSSYYTKPIEPSSLVYAIAEAYRGIL